MHRPLTLRALLIYYYRYKDTTYFTFGMLGMLLFISFILIVFVIVPQIQHYLSVQAEIARVEATIKTMEENQAYVSSISQTTEKQQSETVLAALPIVKDYAGVYTAITNAAASTGIILSNFQYEVGLLSESATEGNLVAEMRVNLAASGTAYSVKEFLKKLEESLPLSTTLVVAGDKINSAVEIAFYYGGEQIITVDPKQPLPRLTNEKQNLIDTLATYRPAPEIEPVFTPSETSTGDAGFSEPPF